METCRPPAGDLLHKQEICQSCEQCEGRGRQHVVWAGGTSPLGRAGGWLEGHSLSLDPIVPYGWQRGRMLWPVPPGSREQGCWRGENLP